MSRQRLRAALRGVATHGFAVAPLLERQLGPLIGFHDGRLRDHPELAAKAFRTGAGLYAVDALTVGADAGWVAAAVTAADPSPAAVPASLPDRCDPPVVAAQPTVRAVCDLIVRLRPVLGDRVGLVVVLPAPERLLDRLEATGDEARRWAVAVLMSVMRRVGEQEPDGLFLRPAERGHATSSDGTSELDTVADHYDMALTRLEATSPGVVLLDPRRLLDRDAGAELPITTRLVSTTDEIDEHAPPGEVRAAIERLRAATGAIR